MKTRGFTLIELLAVIIILAIIALIATPAILNTIEDTKKEGAKRSAEGFIDSVNLSLTTKQFDEIISDGIYMINSDGSITGNGKTYEIEVNGNEPSGGFIAIKDGKVVNSLDSESNQVTVIYIDSYKFLYKYDDFDVLDVTTICRLEDDADGSKTITIGDKYICNLGDGIERTFYLLKKEGNNIKLIMDENLGDNVAWCDLNGDEYWDNICDANGAKAHLASQTSEWKKLFQTQITLPKGQDIADAMGDTEWNSENKTGIVGPDWMKTNLGSDSGLYAYWTSTPASPREEYFNYAWMVSYNGVLAWGEVENNESRGVRPVITISTTELKQKII